MLNHNLLEIGPIIQVLSADGLHNKFTSPRYSTRLRRTCPLVAHDLLPTILLPYKMREKDGRFDPGNKPESMEDLKAELNRKMRQRSAKGTSIPLKPQSSPGSRSNSPMMSRQGSRLNLRGGSRPHLSRHRSSLADIAREHKMHSRRCSLNDTRKYFMVEDDVNLIDQNYNELKGAEIDTNDDFILLSTDQHELPLANARSRSPEDPNFILRTGSRVLTQAELELGDSSHNSPFASRNHSLAASQEASSTEESDFEDGLQEASICRSIPSTGPIRFRAGVENDYSSLDISEYSDAEESRPCSNISGSIWSFVLGDVLGFDEGWKRQRIKRGLGTFDPAVALALFMSLAR